MYPLLTRGTGAAWIAGTRAHDFTVDAESAASQVARRRARRRLPLRAEQPDRHADAARRHRGGLRRDATASSSSTRRTTSSPRTTSASALTLLPGRERLVVSRTMSKAFAFAGARVGYLAADPARHRRAAARPAAVPPERAHAGGGDRGAAARPDDAADGRRDRRAARPHLGDAATRSATSRTTRGRTSCSSAASTTPPPRGRALYDRGVLIRDVGIPHHLRVTAGTEDETTAFLDALASIDSAS